MIQIDLYYDFRRPFSYFATDRMHLLTKEAAELTWRPVYNGVLLNLQADREPWAEIKDAFCPAKRANFMADIFRLIQFWKVPFRMPNPGIPACDQAMALAALLERDGTHHSKFHEAVFRGVWQEQKDGNDPDVVVACLDAGGHDPKLLDRAAEEGVDPLTQNTVPPSSEACSLYRRSASATTSTSGPTAWSCSPTSYEVVRL